MHTLAPSRTGPFSMSAKPYTVWHQDGWCNPYAAVPTADTHTISMSCAPVHAWRVCWQWLRRHEGPCTEQTACFSMELQQLPPCQACGASPLAGPPDSCACLCAASFRSTACCCSSKSRCASMICFWELYSDCWWRTTRQQDRQQSSST